MQKSLKNSVVIFNDQPIYSSGLKRIIADSGMLFVKDIVWNMHELLTSLKTSATDIVIIDISLLSLQDKSINLLKSVRSHSPNILVFGLCERDWHNEIPSYFKGMFEGYLCKSMYPGEIKESLCCKGKTNLINFSTLHNLKNHSSLVNKLLSPREKIVIHYLCCGMTVSQISIKLNRSIKTVSTQKRSAMRKLGINSDSEIYRLNNDHS